MKSLPISLIKKIQKRLDTNSLRLLASENNLVDFSSNDYLGFASNEAIYYRTLQFLAQHNIKQNGAKGSRLLAGNYKLYNSTEKIISEFHKSESSLIFNSGYNANLGFFSSIPQRGDFIIYDEYIHASIRDGIAMSHAKSLKFKHNDLHDLNRVLTKVKLLKAEEIYVVTEAVFSMDGDSPNLNEMAVISKNNNTFLVVDEAHSVGVFGNNGVGLVQELNLENEIFARIVTFGKALGCHGAAILGSNKLKEYLINFSRSFIYTTGLPPHTVATIKAVYEQLLEKETLIQLQQNIKYFKSELTKNKLQFIQSNSAIQCCVISGNERVKNIATQIQAKGFDVKPILSPTVPKNEERLRFCLHSYNSTQEISEVLQLLSTFTSS